jgi:hypothetical protein
MKTTANPTYTRQQYMNGECSHHEYYSQFVTESMKASVLARFPVSRLASELAKDRYLNGIDLPIWDTLALNGRICPRDRMKEVGDFPSMVGGVCIVKAAARMIVEENI